MGLADVRLNIECIALRVKNGGYHIETEDIVRCNLTSMNILISHLELIDQVKRYLNGLPGCTQEINRKLQIKYNMQKKPIRIRIDRNWFIFLTSHRCP